MRLCVFEREIEFVSFLHLLEQHLFVCRHLLDVCAGDKFLAAVALSSGKCATIMHKCWHVFAGWTVWIGSHSRLVVCEYYKMCALLLAGSSKQG